MPISVHPPYPTELCASFAWLLSFFSLTYHP